MQQGTKSLAQKRKKLKQALAKQKIWNIGTQYKVSKIINTSKTSEVAIGSHISGKLVAIKRIINPINSPRQLLSLLRQITLLTNLSQHQNIVKIYDFKISPDYSQAFLIMDFIDTDLKKLMQSNQSLTSQEIEYITLQILMTIKYMKECGVLHRDLKPQNILIEIESRQIKVCDFGLSRTVNFQDINSPKNKMNHSLIMNDEKQDQLLTEGTYKQNNLSMLDQSSNSQSQIKQQKSLPQKQKEKNKFSVHVVTRWYRAPQVIVCQGRYGIQIDIWSVGCIFGQLLKMMKQNAQFPTDRIPLFPGKACYPLSPPKDKNKTIYQKVNDFPHSSYDQLSIIFQIIGTPQKQDLQFIKNEKAIAYIKSFVKRQKQSFKNLFNKISPEAVDFLDRILVFHPKKRMTIDQAINHSLFNKIREKFQGKYLKGKTINSVQSLSLDQMKMKLYEYGKFYQVNNSFLKFTQNLNQN